MKASKAEIERALDRPTESVRCFLLHGPDEAGSRALADRLARAMGGDAERVDLEGSVLAKDPALLADEAASSSLFGGARHIRVRASGDDTADAVQALLDLPHAGNPVVILATSLKPTSRLLKLAIASPAILAFASFPPDVRDAVPMVTAIATGLGLRVQPDIARRVFAMAAGDRAVIAREMEKFANFLDAGDGSPRDVDAAAISAIGAGEGESDTATLIDAVLTGAGKTAPELQAVRDAGDDGIPLVRAMLRRLLQLSALRAEADRSGIDQAMNGTGRAIFWKDKPVLETELRRWPSSDLARLVERLTLSQARLLESGSAGPALASQELLAIARAAARPR